MGQQLMVWLRHLEMSADKRNVEWEWYEGVRNCIFVEECLRFLRRFERFFENLNS